MLESWASWNPFSTTREDTQLGDMSSRFRDEHAESRRTNGAVTVQHSHRAAGQEGPRQEGRDFRQDYYRVRDERDHFERKARRSEGVIAEERERRERELAERDANLVSLQRRVEQLEALLATRTDELHAAQTFVSTSDTSTDVEAKTIVDNINYEIAQAATLLSESYRGHLLQTVRPLTEEDVAHCSWWMGEETLNYLRKQVGSEDVLFALQIVLPGCMTTAVSWITSRWFISTLNAEDVAESVLTKIHGHLIQSGRSNNVRNYY